MITAQKSGEEDNGTILKQSFYKQLSNLAQIQTYELR